MAAFSDGKRVLRGDDGSLYKVDPAQADSEIASRGWRDATSGEVDAREKVIADDARYGGIGQTALAMGEKVARVASFGLLDDGGESSARAATLERNHPVLSFASGAAGVALPALATGGVAGALGASTAASGAAVGLASGTADELEQSTLAGRPVNVGNIVLYGLGGELAGRAVPALLRRGLQGLAPAADVTARVAGEAVDDVVVSSEKRALSSAAKEAALLPEGKARNAAMAATADQQIERTSAELADSLEKGGALAEKADAGLDKAVSDLVSEDAPAQVTWANETASSLREMADKLRNRSTPFGPASESEMQQLHRAGAKAASEREMRQLQKEVLEENPKLFPEVAAKAEPSTLDDASRAFNEATGLPDAPKRSARAQAILDKSEARQSQSGAVMFGRPKLDPSKVKGLQAEGSAIAKTLSEDELDAVRSFTARHGDKVGSPEWESAVTKLTVKNPTDAGPLYRGTRMSQESIDDLLRKGEWTNSEPTSLSYNKDISDAFAHGREARGQKVLFQVDQLDEGANFLPREVGIGRSGLEREINLARPTKLRVLGSSVDEDGMTVIRLGSRTGESGHVRTGTDVKGILGSPMGLVSAAGGAAVMLKLADDLLSTNGGAATFKRARAGVRELEEAGAPAEMVKSIRDGLKAKELWGQAAEAEGELQQARGKATGARQALGAKDAIGLRAHLEKPPSERGAAGAGLNQAAESLEDTAQIASKWGLLQKKPLAALQANARTARRAVADADASFSDRPGQESAKPIWNRIGESSLSTIQGAARRMVRPTYVDGTETGSGSGFTASALSRFQGDYSTPDQAYAARTKMLDQVALNPTAIVMSVAQSTGDMARTNPRLFQQLAGRVQSQFAYVSANLPVSAAVSMAYPRGIPPSRSQLADYAELWNSTFEPETVLQDLAQGQASPGQMKVLRDVHPDLYEQTKEAVLFEVANSYADVPTQRKQQLDILFDSDGIAGPCFTWRCSDYIDEANQAAMQRGPAGPVFDDGPSATQGGNATQAGSINAIRNGVTNRGA